MIPVVLGGFNTWFPTMCIGYIYVIYIFDFFAQYPDVHVYIYNSWMNEWVTLMTPVLWFGLKFKGETHQ